MSVCLLVVHSLRAGVPNHPPRQQRWAPAARWGQILRRVRRQRPRSRPRIPLHSVGDKLAFIIALHDSVCGVWTMQRLVDDVPRGHGPKGGGHSSLPGPIRRRPPRPRQRPPPPLEHCAAGGSFYIQASRTVPTCRQDPRGGKRSGRGAGVPHRRRRRLPLEIHWRRAPDTRRHMEFVGARASGPEPTTGVASCLDGMKGRYTMTDGYSYGDFELVSNAPNDIHGTDRRDNGWHSPMSGAIQADGLLRIEAVTAPAGTGVLAAAAMPAALQRARRAHRLQVVRLRQARRDSDRGVARPRLERDRDCGVRQAAALESRSSCSMYQP